MNESLTHNTSRNVLAAMFAVIFVAFGTSAMAYTGEEFAKDAKMDIQAARDIALKARPGKITDEELEKESGGTGLRYSFDIKAGSRTYEWWSRCCDRQGAREQARSKASGLTFGQAGIATPTIGIGHRTLNGELIIWS